MKIEEKLSVNKFEIDREVHITVNEKLCQGCVDKICVYTCPAECYSTRGKNVTFSYEGCLECGSCRIACKMGAINWVYPRGGFGICYQFG
ncbi:MAG: ferredoxin family protein [Smithellaceae bacterium]